MNWLAHIFLSENKIDFQLGNFLADQLKGRLCELRVRNYWIHNPKRKIFYCLVIL